MTNCPSGSLNVYSSYALSHVLVPLTIAIVLLQHVKNRSTALFAAISIIYMWETFETFSVCALKIEMDAREGVWGDETRWNSLVLDIATGIPAVLIAVLLSVVFDSPVIVRKGLRKLPFSLGFLALVASSSLISEFRDYLHGVTVVSLYMIYLKINKHALALITYIVSTTVAASTRGGSLLTLVACVNVPVLLLFSSIAAWQWMNRRMMSRVAVSKKIDRPLLQHQKLTTSVLDL